MYFVAQNIAKHY